MKNPVLYEARYEKCYGLYYPVLQKDTGAMKSFRDARECLMWGQRNAPDGSYVKVVSLRYSDATGCYEQF